MENTLENSKQIEICLFSTTKIRNDRLGIVYRKLRKFKEMNENYENLENKQSHFNRDKNLSSKRKKNENKFLLPRESEDKIINFALDKHDSESKDNKAKVNINIHGSNNDQITEKKLIVEKGSENNFIESEKAKKILQDITCFENEFIEKWKEALKCKIKSFTHNKKIKNVFPKLKFNKKEIIIDQYFYPLDNLSINFEVLIIDIVMIFHKNNEKLFNLETKNIGTYMLFYIFKEVSNKFLSNYKKIFECSCLKLAHQYLKKMKNPINEIYLKTYEIFYSLWINLKNQFINISKLKLHKNDNTFLDKLVLNEISRFAGPISKIKQASFIDYDKEELDSIFFNNPNYLNLSIRRSKTLSQIRTDMFGYLGETKSILFEQFKSKQLSIRINKKFYSKIANNHIFKENTISLIIDFLQ